MHWTDKGPTIPANLLLLCPFHHRALHHGEFSIEGEPEAGTVRFLDRFGQPIAPPGLDPPGAGQPAPPGDRPPGRPPGESPSPYTPPLAERLRSDSFTWN